MKRIFTHTLFALMLSLPAYAQTVLSGTVQNQQGEALPLANVVLENTYDGATTDANGAFQFTTTEAGPQVIVVRFIGYQEFRQEVKLDGKPLKLTMVLHEAFDQLEAVTISAGAFTASDASRRTIFRALDIATTAGATADIAGALNTLPGTQKVGESGRLFVRGGDSNEARTFIDGMLVIDPYSPSAPNTPSRGRFLPFMFKGTSFSTGGYSAEYGQALSSALALDSKDEEKTTRTDIGILSVGGDVAHTQAWNTGSAGGKIEYTNIRPYFGLINQRVDWKDAPATLEGSGAIRQQVGKDAMLKFYGNFSQSDFSLYNHDIDNYNHSELFSLNNGYRYISTTYKDPLGANWLVRGGLSYTSITNDADIGIALSRETERGLHAKAALEGSITSRIELKTGVEMISRRYQERYQPTPDSLLDLAFNETITAAFAELDMYASKKFVTRVGGRGEYNSLIGQASIDPRISLAYKAGTHGQVSFAFGTFRQSAKNQYVRVNEQLAPEKAIHYILNYQRIEDDKTFRVEAYYKKYNQLVRYINNDPYALNNAGLGYARGLEVFWRDNHSIRRLDYWLSYSFLDTERDYLNFPYAATPSFASSHNFSVVGKYFIQSLKSQVGATYSYTTGRPYNNPNEDAFNHARTPSYQDLSLNWSYLPKSWLIVHLSCTNLLGRNNIFGYEYSDVRNSEGFYNSRPIRQAAPRFLFMAFFITLSKDKLVNQLPSL
jgi:hypothetical protein